MNENTEFPADPCFFLDLTDQQDDDTFDAWVDETEDQMAAILSKLYPQGDQSINTGRSTDKNPTWRETGSGC